MIHLFYDCVVIWFLFVLIIWFLFIDFWYTLYLFIVSKSVFCGKFQKLFRRSNTCDLVEDSKWRAHPEQILLWMTCIVSLIICLSIIVKQVIRALCRYSSENPDYIITFACCVYYSPIPQLDRTCSNYMGQEQTNLHFWNFNFSVRLQR